MPTALPELKPEALRKASEYFRTAVSRGIAEPEQAIQFDGGNVGAGLIKGFSVIAQGDALGHDLWIDETFLSQVAEAINAAPSGVKSRFTHPSLSGDGLGTAVGRVFAARVENGQVLADIHMSKSAHSTPDGDLAQYLMDLASEDPDMFGASISFRHDWLAEDKFIEDNQDSEGRFASPDPMNKQNFPHARLQKLRAVDFVDTPAANPTGLFHADPFAMLENGEAVLDFVFGIAKHAPEANFGVDATRLKGFVARWAASRNLSINKDSDMAKENASTETPEAAAATAPVESPSPVVETAASGQNAALTAGVAATSAASAAPALTPAASPAPTAAPEAGAAENEFRTGLKQYMTLFGAEQGAEWYAAGKPLDECKDLHIKKLETANLEQAKRIEAASNGSLGEAAPLSATPAGETKGKVNKYERQCGENIGRVATAIDEQLQRSRVPAVSKN